MKNNFFKNIKIKIFYFILITILNFNNAYSEILKEILIKGNERLSIETIIMFSGLDLNTEIDNNKLNLSIKNLYKTNYFKNIKMTLNNNILEIEIVENPIIQTIKIEGIKNKEILESLENITKKDEKYPF